MFKLATAISILALVASSQAMAAAVLDQFTFTSDTGSYSWVLPAAPTETTNLGYGFSVNVASLGTVVDFLNVSAEGGFAFENSSASFSAILPTDTSVYVQLYSGNESSPQFTLGNYIGYNQLAHQSTLTISQFTAPVPEPETYGMMLAGLGLMGFMINRKKSV
jgi:hypothetical protein